MMREKRSKSHSLSWYLNRYIKYQDKIMLVHRPTLEEPWSDRCLFLSEDYIPTKPYNHRSVLWNEIIIEFDNDDKVLNKKFTDAVCKKLDRDNIHYLKAFSGGKSYHLHFFIECKNVKNMSLLKRTILKHYTEGVGEQPDFRLCCDNHLIRAENGVHEKTGMMKKILMTKPMYPNLSRVHQDIWKKYETAEKISISQRLNYKTHDLATSEEVKFLLSTKFKDIGDGRERVLWVLVHVLKGQYKEDKQGLTKFLSEWYKYSGGYQLSEEQIRAKVHYHFHKKYAITVTYLQQLIEEIGGKQE